MSWTSFKDSACSHFEINGIFIFLIDLGLNKYQSTGNFNNSYSRVHFGTHM